MAHEIDTSNSRANIAYAGEKPWHGLGFQINADASIDEWRAAAGLDWQIKKGSMHMQTEDGELLDASILNRSILYRSDTKAPLSVMSTKGYHVVQPEQRRSSFEGRIAHLMQITTEGPKRLEHREAA